MSYGSEVQDINSGRHLGQDSYSDMNSRDRNSNTKMIMASESASSKIGR